MLRRTVATFEVFLLLFSFEYIEGQNVILHVDSCYEVGTDMTITAEYTGSDSVSTMEWFYSEQTSSNTVIIPGTCAVFGSIGAGFPTPFSRISFQCPSTGLPQHNFTLTVENITEAELTNKIWGAKFVLGNDPAEEDEKNVTMCQGSASTSSTTVSTSSTNTSTSYTNTTPSVNASTKSTTANPPPKNRCDRTCIILAASLGIGVILSGSFLVCFLLRRRRNIKKKKDSPKKINSDQPSDIDIVMTSDTRGYRENNRL